VWADASLMTRVFQNLLGNAIKFRQDDAPPAIAVEAHDQGTEWEIVVTDNGIGIDSRHQERVFLIFQRIGNKKRGMGLGLALCKRIMDRHGGRIWFESKGKGLGTSFHFTLPKKEPLNE
jgi:signal transduction histidine kinase